MKVNSYKPIDVSTVAFPVALPLTGSTSRYKLFGAKTLSTNVVVDPSGTPKEGMAVDIDYTAAITPGIYGLIIFGQAVPATILGRKLKIHCEYHSGAWAVFILQSMGTLNTITPELISADVVDNTTLAIDGTSGKFKIKDAGVDATQLATDAVETVKIKAKAVTLAKMADLASGALILGGSTNLPTEVVPTGDVTITNAGVMAIGADKVLAGMVKAKELDTSHLADDAAVKFTQMEALTAGKVPVLNGSGFIEASGVSAAELVGFRDSIAKVSHAIISTDTTVTAATLKSSYIGDTTAGAVALTLPLGSTLVIGTPVRLLRIGGNDASLKPNAADKIYPPTSYTVDTATVACSGTGKSITAILVSVSEWQVIQAD